MPDDELKVLRVSTAAYRESGGVEAFLEIFGRKILGIEIDPLDGHPIEIDFTLRSLPGFAMASGSLSPMHNRHTPALIDNDDLVLVVMERGLAEVNQYGRVATIDEGEAVLTANGAAAALAGPAPTRVTNFRLSRNLLSLHVADVDDLVARPIAKDNRVLRLMLGYAAVLKEQNELGTAELRHIVGMHMHDLAALLLNGDGGQGLQAPSLRAARLLAIKDNILQSMRQPGLTIADIARAQQISASYIRQLLAEDGTTFTDFILSARVTQAHRLLMDPRYRDRNISAIAYETGFSDLSYFNRAFRRRFGATPSDVREAARRRNDT